MQWQAPGILDILYTHAIQIYEGNVAEQLLAQNKEIIERESSNIDLFRAAAEQLARKTRSLWDFKERRTVYELLEPLVGIPTAHADTIVDADDTVWSQFLTFANRRPYSGQ